MPKYTAVLFDFDGTLANTSRGILNSIKYALKEKNIPVGDESRLNYFIGPPLYDGFSHVYGADEKLSEELVGLYRVYYAKSGVYECELYPGVRDMLESLKQAGLTLGVVSSKPKHFLDMAVPHLGISSYFTAVVGPDLKNKDADKSFLIRQALEQMQCGEKTDAAEAQKCGSRSAVIMAGDRFYDIEGAKKEDLTAVGVTYGFGSVEELERAGADYLADSAEDLASFALSD